MKNPRSLRRGFFFVGLDFFDCQVLRVAIYAPREYVLDDRDRVGCFVKAGVLESRIFRGKYLVSVGPGECDFVGVHFVSLSWWLI
jgi:hypothetical protein